MNILTIAARNARRKWARTLLLLTVFTLGVVSIVALAFVSRVVGEGLEKKLVSFGANILVSPRSEKLTVSYGGFSMGDMLFDVAYLDEKDVAAKIDAIPLRGRVSVIAPKLVVMERVNGAAVALVGVRFEQEKLLKGYWMVEQGVFPGEKPEETSARQAGMNAHGEAEAMPREPLAVGAELSGVSAGDSLLAGSAAARKLNLTVGSKVPLGHHVFTVAGILGETGGEDDNVLLADMDALQKASGRVGKVNFVEVAALCSGCPIEDIVAQLSAALPGVDIKTLRGVVEQRMVSVHFVKKLILSVSLVILLTGCSMVGVSMLSAVNERKKEIGILRSLGFSRRAVFAIFSAEAASIGLLAGLLGYLAGYLVSFRILAALEVEGAGSIAFDPLHLAATALVLALLTSLASLFPAWKAAGVEPSEALVTL